MNIKNLSCALGVGLSLGLLARTSAAQSSLLEDKKTTEGTTDVAAEGFQSATAPPEELKKETTIKLSGGGFYSTGNARSLALTGSGHLRIRRHLNQYTAEIATNFAQSSSSSDEPIRTTVRNTQGRIRYDRFLSEKWALFVQESARRDRFQGLDLRLNFDPGLTYYVIMQEKQHLNFDAGYDLQYDIRSENARNDAAQNGEPIDGHEVRHAMRLFAGYDNNLNEHVRFDTGFEYLQAFASPRNFRINWVSSLTASISNSFSLATGFTLRYDNNPLPGIKSLDTITTISLVFTMME